MTDRPRRRFWLKLSTGLLFAVVACGGAYVAMVESRIITLPVASPPVPRVQRGMGQQWIDLYAWGYAAARQDQYASRAFFMPANCIDRKLRPGFWND